VTQQPTYTRHQSPASIRSEVFSHRMRGLDEEEVREYLDLLADQVEATEADRAASQRELERLREENRRLRDAANKASNEISPQAVALFSQAQQVADQLVEEAVIHARDLMQSARHQQRDILQRAHDTAAEVARRAGAVDLAPAAAGRASATALSGYTTPVPEIEYVRTFARVAQVQLRSVLDALTEQVDRLGEVPQLDDAGVALGREVNAVFETHSFPMPHSRAPEDPLGVSRDGDPDGDGGSGIYEQIWSLQSQQEE
jgi:DivIVA domain-containing protein